MTLHWEGSGVKEIDAELLRRAVEHLPVPRAMRMSQTTLEHIERLALEHALTSTHYSNPVGTAPRTPAYMNKYDSIVGSVKGIPLKIDPSLPDGIIEYD